MINLLATNPSFAKKIGHTMFLIETRIVRDIGRRDIALSREDEKNRCATHTYAHTYAHAYAGYVSRGFTSVPVRSCGMLVCQAPSLPFQWSNRL